MPIMFMKLLISLFLTNPFLNVTDMLAGHYKCTLNHNGTQKEQFKLNVQKSSAVLSDLLRDVLHPVTFLCDLLDLSPANTSSLDSRLHEECKNYLPAAGFKNHLPVKISGMCHWEDFPFRDKLH